MSRDDSFMLGHEFMNGIARLSDYGLSYDILVYPRQLPAAIKLAATFPDQRFVLDHIGKPDVKKGHLEGWKANLEALAKHTNVCCKLSGIVTEARWNDWKRSDFDPFLDVVIDAFGEDRLMIGSDWPVCLVAARSYREVMNLVEEKIEKRNLALDKIQGTNACNFYNITETI